MYLKVLSLSKAVMTLMNRVIDVSRVISTNFWQDNLMLNCLINLFYHVDNEFLFNSKLTEASPCLKF